MHHQSQFKQLLHESVEKVAEMAAKEEIHEQGFQPVHFRQKQIQEQLKEHVQTVEKKIYEGLQIAILSLSKCQNPLMSIDEVVEELQSCLNVINSPEAVSALGLALLSGTSWKDHLAISDKCMDALYQGTKYIFNEKEYDQAEKAFFVLCSIDPTQFAYWVGLGHSMFQNKNYHQAINAYSMASLLDPENGWPHVWAANSFEEIKDFAYAKVALEEALALENAKTPKNQEFIHFLEERVRSRYER